MSFSIFISYSMVPEENAVPWRMQILAASEGAEVFVPRRPEFESPSPRRSTPRMPERVQKEIDRCGCVLAVVTSNTIPSMEKELSYALQKRKLIVPVVDESVVEESVLGKLNPIFRFSRLDESPGKVADQVLEFLKRKGLDKENRQILVSIIAIGVGLLLLSGLAED
jgi:hypothetical protein